MVRTRKGACTSKEAVQSTVNTSCGEVGGCTAENEPISITRGTIAEEVTKAIQAAMPAILEQVNESTRKMIDDKVVLVEKEKKQIKEETCKILEDGEIADFSDCMPEFNGLCDGVTALRWILEMENIFKAIKCADEEKVYHAVTKLRTEAFIWWDMVKNSREPETATKMTWSQFKEVFKDKYCPLSMLMQFEEELLTFKQGNQTVQEYTARFVEMARFAEHQVATEGRKIQRYIRGLRTSIRDLVSARKLSTFKEVVEAAQEIENGKKKQEKNDFKRKRDGSESRKCSKCQKSHEGECRYRLKGCYRCGDPNHLSRECSLSGKKTCPG